jgi:hypothetical protein
VYRQSLQPAEKLAWQEVLYQSATGAPDPREKKLWEMKLWEMKLVGDETVGDETVGDETVGDETVPHPSSVLCSMGGRPQRPTIGKSPFCFFLGREFTRALSNAN